MIIIHSSSYVPPELQEEFGVIPPCMLPLANRKLIEHQAGVLKEFFPEVMLAVSLPEHYELTMPEADLLGRLELKIIHMPEGFSLRAALASILDRLEIKKGGVRLLRGDTAFGSFPLELDVVSVVPGQSGCAGEKTQEGPGAAEERWAGFFSFSSPENLARCMAPAGHSFSDAIRAYARVRPLRFVPAPDRYELGHSSAYFRSRAALTSQRAFNSLTVSASIVTKTGIPAQKIEAEANWFCRVPPHIKKYTPQLIAHGHENGQPYYQLEYLPLSPLNELFVHGRNPVSFWEYAFDRIENFFRDAAVAVPCAAAVQRAARKLYVDKTRQRLRLFIEAEGLDATKPLHYAGARLPSLQDICEECLHKTLELPCVPGILHGDLCLSNIFIDKRSGNIKLIDPRGLDNDNAQTIYGDQKYDLAKLAHSCIGLYDFIISGYYRLEANDACHYDLRFVPDERLTAIQATFWQKKFMPQCSVAEIMPLTILLFLSMLPLHNDNHIKQQALFANALRLYQAHVAPAGARISL
jgi:fructosamine-3-kinase